MKTNFGCMSDLKTDRPLSVIVSGQWQPEKRKKSRKDSKDKSKRESGVGGCATNSKLNRSGLGLSILARTPIRGPFRGAH